MESTNYKNRRIATISKLKDGIAILPAATHMTRSNDTEFDFRQNSNFKYLTGCSEPDTILVLTPHGKKKDHLFVRPNDRMAEIWAGRRLGVEKSKDIWPDFFEKLPENIGLSVIRNKADLSGKSTGLAENNGLPTITLSAKTGQGTSELKEHLKEIMGYQGNTEGGFMARRRHLSALKEAHNHLSVGLEQLEAYVAGEILAEELRLCQEALNTITGEFTNDDLLGEIFSSFCIGK